MKSQAAKGDRKWKHSEAGIGFMQEVYVIAIVFAFHKLSEALYAYFVGTVTWWAPGAPFHPLVLEVTLPALAIITFGLRFFWCVDLLKLCIDNGMTGRIKLGISLAVFLLQAFIVYFLAALLAEFVESPKCGRVLDEQKDAGLLFFGWSTALAAVNMAWLACIPWNHLRKRNGASLKRTVEKWIWNNLFFGCVGTAFLAISWFEGHLGHDGWILAWSGGIFTLNSLVDFWLNWKHYFLKERKKSDNRSRGV